MKRLSLRQRRRWMPILIGLLLLHWGAGIGEALASVLCFEPDGRVALEQAGKLCCDPVKKLQQAVHCADVPEDDGHVPYAPTLGGDAKQAAKAPAALQVITPFFLPQPVAGPHRLSPTSPPFSGTLPVVLRASTVLLI